MQKKRIQTAVSMKMLKTELPRYSKALKSRLEASMSTYGDASFSKKANLTAAEVLAELIDINGWSFILWCRMRVLTKTLRKLESLAAKLEKEPQNAKRMVRKHQKAT